MKNRYSDAKAYITKDGSEIRELMHPNTDAVRNQSLAEAIVLPGQSTQLHLHHISEEVYHITRGQGLMTLAGDTVAVGLGDTLLIPPGTAHTIRNTGNEPLHILCICSPAYSHADTQLLKHHQG